MSIQLTAGTVQLLHLSVQNICKIGCCANIVWLLWVCLIFRQLHDSNHVNLIFVYIFKYDHFAMALDRFAALFKETN